MDEETTPSDTRNLQTAMPPIRNTNTVTTPRPGTRAVAEPSHRLPDLPGTRVARSSRITTSTIIPQAGRHYGSLTQAAWCADLSRLEYPLNNGAPTGDSQLPHSEELGYRHQSYSRANLGTVSHTVFQPLSFAPNHNYNVFGLSEAHRSAAVQPRDVDPVRHGQRPSPSSTHYMPARLDTSTTSSQRQDEPPPRDIPSDRALSLGSSLPYRPRRQVMATDDINCIRAGFPSHEQPGIPISRQANDLQGLGDWAEAHPFRQPPSPRSSMAGRAPAPRLELDFETMDMAAINAGPSSDRTQRGWSVEATRGNVSPLYLVEEDAKHSSSHALIMPKIKHGNRQDHHNDARIEPQLAAQTERKKKGKEKKKRHKRRGKPAE